MTQDERDAILGRTRREYREARAEFGAIKKRHAELVTELKRFTLALEKSPLHLFVSNGPRGTLQTAIEAQGAEYFYSAALAGKLSVDSVRSHLDEYRDITSRVEDRRQSLIEQGEDDPGSINLNS